MGYIICLSLFHWKATNLVYMTVAKIKDYRERKKWKYECSYVLLVPLFTIFASSSEHGWIPAN